MPARRNGRRFRIAVEYDPAPLRDRIGHCRFRPVVAVTLAVGPHQLTLAPCEETGGESLSAPPRKELFQKAHFPFHPRVQIRAEYAAITSVRKAGNSLQGAAISIMSPPPAGRRSTTDVVFGAATTSCSILATCASLAGERTGTA